MPTYEYACRQCGEHLDVVQRFTDDALSTCPSCGGPLRKVFGNIGISFKGSGFYKNDSRSSGNGSAKEQTAKEQSAKDKKDEAPAKAETTASKAGDSTSSTPSSDAAKPPKASAPTAAP